MLTRDVKFLNHFLLEHNVDLDPRMSLSRAKLERITIKYSINKHHTELPIRLHHLVIDRLLSQSFSLESWNLHKSTEGTLKHRFWTCEVHTVVRLCIYVSLFNAASWYLKPDCNCFLNLKKTPTHPSKVRFGTWNDWKLTAVVLAQLFLCHDRKMLLHPPVSFSFCSIPISEQDSSSPFETAAHFQPEVGSSVFPNWRLWPQMWKFFPWLDHTQL